jgi:hypothetical protein
MQGYYLDLWCLVRALPTMWRNIADFPRCSRLKITPELTIPKSIPDFYVSVIIHTPEW